MPASVVVDAGFLVTLLNKREAKHAWAVAESRNHPPPWHTCEAVLSETFFFIDTRSAPAVTQLMSHGALRCSFSFADAFEPVLSLMAKYSDVPMSFADACLVRMTEMLPNPLVLTTDSDFRIYRRYGRRIIPCVLPDRGR